jgi:hypothetical protein
MHGKPDECTVALRAAIAACPPRQAEKVAVPVEVPPPAPRVPALTRKYPERLLSRSR